MSMSQDVRGVELPWIEPVEVDAAEVAEPGAAARWWNTGVQHLMNPTLGLLTVLNQETQAMVVVQSAGAALVQWLLPWCDTYDEVASKSLVFRIFRPGVSGAGERIFSVFQDYRSNRAMWLPAGVTDFQARSPIETFVGSGVFLPPCSVLNVRVGIIPPGNLLVPVGDVVVR
ncbi:hypothetical protein KOI35_37075 [Actinoplanes bogorensis]|uniref:Uncharacterized protein n=1 Tax=Paractinoplanes bogorensis TaxID=1610840 RepID=A0ABS5Z1E5_9ACTN|nr:hypothetical protein [Actinoplanes bogorensis]MBU2669141.1 hypothetical protein [Actinoplanes bogorensis]